jgi:hypothetical protein
MKRRKIDPETKMAAVLEGLRGESTEAEHRGGTTRRSEEVP